MRAAVEGRNPKAANKQTHPVMEQSKDNQANGTELCGRNFLGVKMIHSHFCPLTA